MRETHTAQTSIFQSTTDHEIAYELKRMSDWLDTHPELLDLGVLQDSCRINQATFSSFSRVA